MAWNPLVVAAGDKLLEQKQDGDLLSNDWLKWSLDMREPQTVAEARDFAFEWMAKIEEFKSFMLKVHKVKLDNVRGKGYRIVPPREQAEVAAMEAAEGIRKALRKGRQTIDNTRVDQLTTEEARRHTDVDIKMAALEGLSGKGTRDVFALFRGKSLESR